MARIALVLALCFWLTPAHAAKDIVTRLTAPAGSILAATYDEETTTILLQYPEQKVLKVPLNPEISAAQFFEIGDDLLRYYSRAFYRSFGQTPADRVLLSKGLSIKSLGLDATNAFAAESAPAENLTNTDFAYLAMLSLVRRHNQITTKNPLCMQEKATELLPRILADQCYVVCGGLSVITSQTMPGPVRTVSIIAKIEKLARDVEFHWSEGHTLVELKDGEKWYAADPTFGFAYVKNKAGVRLGPTELINELAEGAGNDLVFGMVFQDSIRDVPGYLMLQANPVLSSIYYTTDKRLAY